MLSAIMHNAPFNIFLQLGAAAKKVVSTNRSKATFLKMGSQAFDTRRTKSLVGMGRLN